MTLDVTRSTCVLKSACLAPLTVGVLAIGASSEALVPSPAIAETAAASQLPSAPPNGVMGFVVHHFAYSVLQGKDACPEGLAPQSREIFLSSLPPQERARLEKPENRDEFFRRWRASVSRPDGTNLCTQPSLFPERGVIKTVQSKHAWGLNLDDDEGDGSSNPEGCAHENFVTPDGQKGIDNQAYRALGCTIVWRGIDGVAGDIQAMSGSQATGEHTQVLLLRGVDSLVNDDNVEVVYANTADRPIADSTGKFIWNASFTITDKAPRERNVLRGRIDNGVLTTQPQLVKLTHVYGLGGRDTRGVRGRHTLHKGRIRLTFQPDGSLKGVVGGYQPFGELHLAPTMGGMGSIITGGFDCAAEHNTMKKLADGMRDPKTGECTAISTGYELRAVPAFVNDVAPTRNIAQK